MKRKIFCLLIALVMLMALMPAVSLVASAAAPAVGTYEYYEAKGMWYDGGHLESFVDLTHFTDLEKEVVVNNSSLDLEELATNDDVRLVHTPANTYKTTAKPDNGNTNTKFSNGELSSDHTYIKITGGKNAGKFYNVSTSRTFRGIMSEAVVNATEKDATVTIEKLVYPDSNGNMKIAVNDRAVWYDFATTGLGGAGWIVLSRPFAASELRMNWRLTSNKPESKAEGADSASLIPMSDWLTETYNDPTATGNPTDAKFAVETVTRIENFSSTGAPKMGVFAVGDNTSMIMAGDVTKSLSATTLAYVEYADATHVNIVYETMINGAIKSETQSNKEFKTDLQALLVTRATAHSQQLFVRVYDCDLTEDQMKQNHLADLMYYYDIDLGTLDADDFTKFYDEAVALNVGLHNEGDEAAEYAATKAALNAMVSCNAGHTSGEDDGDCTTPIMCTKGDHVAVAGASAHVAGNDDGNCLTAVQCANCDQIAVAAETAHTPEADDGDCTTARGCTKCDQVAVAAKTHVPEADDGDCTTDRMCINTGCEKVAEAGADEHTPETDDGDCTTEQGCTECDKVAVAAKDAHTGGTATCTDKAKCSVCNKEYGELAAHTPAEDDGDCTTAVKCTKCDAETTAAKAAHTYGDDDLCTVCGMENPDKGLGTGAVAGIVVGSVAVAGGAGAAIWWFIFKKKKI